MLIITDKQNKLKNLSFKSILFIKYILNLISLFILSSPHNSIRHETEILIYIDEKNQINIGIFVANHYLFIKLSMLKFK